MTHRMKLAGVLGLQEPFQKVQVHVLNDTVETFQCMPLKIEIESVDGQFSKDISLKNVPAESHRQLPSCKLDRTSEKMASPDPGQLCQARKRWTR